MRLAEGIIVEAEPTFGELKYAKIRRERRIQNDDGTQGIDIIARTYDLKCKAQGGTISVTIPGEVPLKEYQYNAIVELVNPMVNTVANAGYGNNASANWYIKADDIVLKKTDLSETLKQNHNKK